MLDVDVRWWCGFFVYMCLNKVNGILGGKNVTSRLEEAVVTLYSVLVRCVWSILLGIGALALSWVKQDVRKLECVERLRQLGSGWCDMQGAPEGSWTCLVSG